MAGYTALFNEAAARLTAIGGTAVPIDFSPFAETAAMLYGTSFIAERYAGIADFLQAAGTTSARSSGDGGSAATAAGAPAAAASRGATAAAKAGSEGAPRRTMSSDSDDSCATAATAALNGGGAPRALTKEDILADECALVLPRCAASRHMSAVANRSTRCCQRLPNVPLTCRPPPACQARPPARNPPHNGCAPPPFKPLRTFLPGAWSG